MVKEGGIDYKVASVSLCKLWVRINPAAEKAQLNEWVGYCNGPFQYQVMVTYMSLSFCTFCFQNFIYMAIDIVSVVR